MGQKILFSSDLQGQYLGYRPLALAAEQQGVERLILGGNLFSEEGQSFAETGALQREFLETAFIPLFEDLLQRSELSLIIHPGSKDLRRPTMRLVMDWCRGQGGRAFVVADGHYQQILTRSLLSYPYVPPTPCSIKDWEKWDSSVKRGIPEAFLKGFRSRDTRAYHPVLLSPDDAADTIDGDLAARGLGLEAEDFVFLAHGPPANSALDMAEKGEHIGSAAIREFIERLQPSISLHGHARESPSLSGRYSEHIGRCLAINPGQTDDPELEPCHFVTFDIDDPEGTLRHSVFGAPQESG